MAFSYGIKTIRRPNQVPDADPARLTASAKLVSSDEEDQFLNSHCSHCLPPFNLEPRISARKIPVPRIPVLGPGRSSPRSPA
jgi:hypothetical protein